MVKRVLVTTALEETWPKDGAPILFLGEWCKLYARKHIWQDFDYEVAQYHWDDRKKLFNDYKDLQVIYERALRALAKKLNQINGVDHSLRYWRILTGPWLGYFIQMLYDRWLMLDSAHRNYEITEVTVFHRGTYDVVPGDMQDFCCRFVEDDWNEAIYGELLSVFFKDRIVINLVEKKNAIVSPKLNELVGAKPKINLSLVVKKGIKRALQSLAVKNPGKTDYFFIKSYLPLKIQILLQLKLNQFPKFFFSTGIDKSAPQIEAREWSLELENDNSKLAGFGKILAYMIPRHIPTAYLEDYANLAEMAQQMSWPNRPKAIFTSNAYSSDDVFKAWAAEKTEMGSKLLIGQHGGHFGMTPFAFHEEHQIEIADQWFSWGWSDPSRAQIRPVGNFKDSGIPKIKNNKNGIALLVQMTKPRYSYHLFAVPVSASQWNSYFEEQVRFVSCLKEEIRKDLLVRLRKQDYGCGQDLRWRDSFQDILLDDGKRPMRELLKKSRIYISTYNATTYLESFAMNFPTLIFWNPNQSELKSDVVPYFDLLESVGVFHKTPEAAAQKLNEIWSDVDSWWQNPERQKAIKAFCENFSKPVEYPVMKLASIIAEA